MPIGNSARSDVKSARIDPGEKRRWRIGLIAIALALLGTFVPLFIANKLAAESALAARRLQLELVARKVAERATIALLQARSALDALDALDEKPCSSEHVETMRRFTVNTLSVEEIAYVEHGRIQCTTWRDGPGFVPKPDFVLEGGVQAFMAARSQIPGAHPMLGLMKAHHLVLINLDRFTDIKNPFEIKTAFLRMPSTVLSMSPGLTSEDLWQVLKPASSSDGPLLFSMEFSGWRAVAFGEPDAGVFARRRLWMVYAASIIVSCLLIFLIFRLAGARFAPETELRIALRKREFFVEYQPIIDLLTGGCVGAEALVRWRRPDGHVVSPDSFIPLAEATGTITLLTAEVARLVADDLGPLLSTHPALHICINVSAQDLGSVELLEGLASTLSNAGIQHTQVWLELTERVSVQSHAMDGVLETARSRGFRIAIDDFGTGYSSLQYLHALPVDCLKIDRSFVQTIVEDSVGLIVPHIIELARSRNLLMVAEGVETSAQAEYLRQHGVHHAQGWLFSRPLAAHAFVEFLHGSNRPPLVADT